LKKVQPLVPAAAASWAAESPLREAVEAKAQFGPPNPANAFWNKSPSVSVPKMVRSYSL